VTNIFGKPLSTESTKINNIENVRGFFFALSLFFIFIGDIEFWVGASSFTLPLAFLASGPLVVYASFKAVAKKDIDIIPVLFFGILSLQYLALLSRCSP